MKPVIAVPYFPGSNGDHDAILRIKEANMTPLPLYFHIGDEKRLQENEAALKEVDGAVLCGGFPYEDRLGFGVVPAKVKHFAQGIRYLVDSGKPVIAFCSGNQIAHVMGLAFPKDSDYKVRMLPNICDKDGEIVYEGFLNTKLHTKMFCTPKRTAFTRLWKPGEIVKDIIAHGGGRFWADDATLKYLFDNDMVVARYSDSKGNVLDEFPVNPNGSMHNIESITNMNGNLKIGMCHNERVLNALKRDRANLVFQSMKEFIEDGCPNLRKYADIANVPKSKKTFEYLCHDFDPKKTIDIYVKMLTDDNERTMAQLFLGDGDIDRRRLLRVELDQPVNSGLAKKVVEELASMDFLHGIMLKKDLPSVTVPGSDAILTYEVVGKGYGGKKLRDFTKGTEIVKGHPVQYIQVSQPNVGGYTVKKVMQQNPFLREHVKHVNTGMAWFFPSEELKTRALDELLE